MSLGWIPTFICLELPESAILPAMVTVAPSARAPLLIILVAYGIRVLSGRMKFALIVPRQ